MKDRGILKIGTVLPRIMIAALVADIFLRLSPLHWLAFRALEGAQRHTFSCMGPFEPNIQFSSSKSYGDLASMGNLSAQRQYRDITFTTDSLGFHNPAAAEGIPKAMLIGDSFAIASEVPGDRSFSAQLALMEGSPVFNAGEDEPLVLAPILTLADKLRMHRGLVIYEFLERHLTESPPYESPTGKKGLKERFPTFLGAERWDTYRLPIWHALEFSPLQALAGKIQKSASTGYFLPNRYTNNILVRNLANNETMLFLPRDVSDPKPSDLQMRRWVQYWIWLSSELQKRDLSLLVMLVPNKYTVYEPLLLPYQPKPHAGEALDELAGQLQSARVPVVNLVKTFRTQAARLLGDNKYLYWRDDTHWNELGMSIAAHSVHEYVHARAF